MTLLHCLACSDVLRLDGAQRACRCGRSAGAAFADGTRFHGPARLLRFEGDAGPAGRWEALPEHTDRRLPVTPLV